MSIGSGREPSVLEKLSALADGELDSASVAYACAAWRDDEDVRVSWHAYQLVGDVLRSDDLASTPEHDGAFLAALRARLADEPVVLAPQSTPSSTPEEPPAQPPGVPLDGHGSRPRPSPRDSCSWPVRCWSLASPPRAVPWRGDRWSWPPPGWKPFPSPPRLGSFLVS